MPRKWRKPVYDGKTRLKNIYRDNSGYEIIKQRKGRTHRERFDRDTSIPDLKKALIRIESDLIVKVAKTAPGTLRADIAAYIKTLPETRMTDVRSAELAAWVSVWGDFRRDQITPQIVRGQLAQWQLEGVIVRKKVDGRIVETHRPAKASTLNHRRQALRSLYKALDGSSAPTPCDEVKKAKERRQIRDVPRAVGVAILRQVKPTKTGARIKLLARTGWPHTQIGQLQPHDIDYATRMVRVSGRLKGGGTRDQLVPVTYAALRALRLMARTKAWGAFSPSSLWKAFQRAVERAKAKWQGIWPAGHVRPYDLRHAFITDALERSGDLVGTSVLALHSNVSMTAFYAGAAANRQAMAVRDRMDAPRLALKENRPKSRP